MNNDEWQEYLSLMNNNQTRYYDCINKVVHFYEQGKMYYLEEIIRYLKYYSAFVTTKETFKERKNTRQNDEEYKTWWKNLRLKRNNRCEVSKMDFRDAAKLNKDIFGIEFKNANYYLNAHHIDGQSEYKCFDEDKIIIVNRAIHMMLHMYNNLVTHLPALENNYRLWFELGSLIPDDKGVYPWVKPKIDFHKLYPNVNLV